MNKISDGMKEVGGRRDSEREWNQAINEENSDSY
jgi:hypothetical protein